MTIEIKTVPAALFLASTHETTIPEIAALGGEVPGMIYAAAEEQSLAVGGPIYFFYDGADGSMEKVFTLKIGVPLLERPEAEAPGPFQVYEAPEFHCIAMDYIGGMPGIQNGYKMLMDAMKEQGLRATWETREIYKHWVDYDSPENVTELQLGLA
ncbi:MAG: GyrI-like domain-containing protein [Capsulimonas sp.]|uniref:GyrI-like domain-containing protein n=1 Tax=Capsulimonas sp. TaxID=2494211 RepID=UPI0032665913